MGRKDRAAHRQCLPPRYEDHLQAAWRDLAASVEALCAELKTAPPAARRKALAAVARALREPGRRVKEIAERLEMPAAPGESSLTHAERLMRELQAYLRR